MTRRASIFWSGVFSDMVIEQDLMRVLKVDGGMVGRAITENTLARWTLTIPYTNDICKEIEKFCGIHFSTSAQHIDVTDARMKKDNADMLQMFEWFKEHNPFPKNPFVTSISTGITGGDNINCYDCYEIGRKSVEEMVGKTFSTVKMSRSKRVIPLSAMSSSIKNKDNIVVPIDPNLLFQRMNVIKNNDKELKDYLQYELAPYPMSIFNESEG